MIIAINTRFLLPNQMEGYGNYTYEIFTRVALLQPQNIFYFIVDREINLDFELPKNIKIIVLSPKARHPLLWYYWYNFKIPFLLKKIQADLFISPDGFCSLTTKVPQITVIHDLAFLHQPKAIKKSHLWFYKNQTPKFIKKSKDIITVSEYSKLDIIKNYATNENKISVIYNAATELYKPIDWTEFQSIKEQYTNGKEYFICVTSIHPRKNIINLLKAFSIFKKWQKSNMKLVLVGRLAWKNDEFMQLYNTYKYKNDVLLLGYLPTIEVNKLLSAAYCAIYISLFEGFGVPILEAMQSAVPVITSNNSGMLEAGGNAALYANPNNVDEIATQMQLIYKDEQLRSKLIILGKEQALKFDWNKSAEEMSNLIKLELAN